MSSQFCGNCGARLTEQATFCGQCGAQVLTGQAKQAQTNQGQADKQQASAQQTYQRQTGPQQTGTQQTNQQQGKFRGGVTYEELQKSNLPKSRGALLLAGFKTWWLAFVKGMPGNLLKPVILALVIFAVNLLVITIGKVTYRINTADQGSSLLLYLFAGDGVYGGEYGIRGCGESYFGSSLGVVLSLDLVLIAGISMAMGRFKKAKKLIFSDIGRSSAVKKAAFTYATQPKNLYFYRGLFTAFVIGFLLKNPLAILSAAFFLMAEAGQAKESELFAFLFQWRIIGNLKKKKPETVMDADVILDIYYTAVGMWIYVPVVAVLWFAFHYHTVARAIVTILFAVLFLFLSQKKVTARQRATVSMLFCVCLVGAIWLVNSMEAEAGFFLGDVPGPGSNKPRRSKIQLREYGAQAKENAGESGGRGFFSFFAMLLAQVKNQIGGFFSGGTYDAINAGMDMANADNSFDMGLAAYQSAMENAGPLGESVANAARNIDSAMQGK